MSSCGVCSKSVPRNDTAGKIQCKACDNFYHSRCVNLKDGEVNNIKAGKQEWECIKCSENERGSVISKESTSTPSIGDIYKLLLSFKKEVADLKMSGTTIEKELGKSLNSVHEKLDNNAYLIKQQTDRITECLTQIEKLKEENALLKKQLNDTQLQLDEHDQYGRRNTVELYGIPEKANEDATEIVINVGKALGMDINREMIDVSHRLKKPTGRNDGGIIVKFVRRTDKEELVRRRKVKRDLNTTNIGFPTNDVIYINQSLTPNRRKIYGAARRLKKERNYAYLWIDNAGNIKLRKQESDRYVYILKTMDDVDKLI